MLHRYCSKSNTIISKKMKWLQRQQNVGLCRNILKIRAIKLCLEEDRHIVIWGKVFNFAHFIAGRDKTTRKKHCMKRQKDREERLEVTPQNQIYPSMESTEQRNYGCRVRSSREERYQVPHRNSCTCLFTLSLKYKHVFKGQHLAIH